MGALSGVTLIGIAIGVFVVIVSAQVFHEWPIADTGSNTSKSSVAPAQAVDSGADTADATTAVTGIDPALRSRRPEGRLAPRSAVPHHPGRDHDANIGSPAAPVESSPAPTTGDETSSSGGDEASRSPRPSTPAPPVSSGSTSSSGPANTASAASSGSGGGSNGSSGGGQTGTSGGSNGAPSGATTIETPVAAAKVPPVSETVNETVHEADEAALGGTLEKTGVTEVTESVVEGVVGPETPVGKTVEGATEAVGGLLGGGGSGGQ